MGLLDNWLWGGEKQPKDECRKLIAGYREFSPGEEYWSYGESPLRGVVVDKAGQKIVVTGYHKFLHGDKANIYNQISAQISDEQPELGFIARNTLVNTQLDDYVAENSIFARMYDYSQLMACELVENGTVVSAAHRRTADALSGGDLKVLGGAFNYKGSNVKGDALYISIVAEEDGQKYVFSLSFAQTPKDKNYQEKARAAHSLYAALSEMIEKIS